MPKYLYYSVKLPKFEKVKEKITNPTKNNLIYIGLWLIVLCFPMFIREYIWAKLQKYFLGAGINFNRDSLRTLIYEAHLLDRVAVISPPFLYKGDNRGKKINNPQWNTYSNLTESYIIQETHQAGLIKRIRLPFKYVLAQDFFRLSNLIHKRIYRTNQHDPISDEQNNLYDLVIKDASNLVVSEYESYWQKERAKLKKKKPNGFSYIENYIDAYGDYRYEVFLEDSDLTKEVARKVTSQLGDFYALHYRLPQNWQGIFKPEQWNKQMPNKMLTVEELAERLPQHIPLQSKIYILSNLWDDSTRYFNPLTMNYRIFQYQDFFELSQYIENSHTFLLFTIEQRIARSAIKLLSVHYRDKKKHQPVVRYMLEPVTE